MKQEQYTSLLNLQTFLTQEYSISNVDLYIMIYYYTRILLVITPIIKHNIK